MDTQDLRMANRVIVAMEAKLVKDYGFQKSWTTLLVDLEGSTQFHVQRKGCEPPSIEISLRYLFESLPQRLDKIHPDDLIRQREFERRMGDAIRQAKRMSDANAFLSPFSARAYRDETHRARVAALRETNGVLPDRCFMVQHIVAITETVSGESKSITILQSPSLPTVYDMVRDGKRLLSEKILQNESLSSMIRFAPSAENDPIPTSVKISDENGATRMSVCYDVVEPLSNGDER